MNAAQRTWPADDIEDPQRAHSREWRAERARMNPDERLPHADALERMMAKRDRLRAEMGETTRLAK